MRREINSLTDQLKDFYEGDPWFGRNAKLLLSEVDVQIAFIRLNGQHSILELVWHMTTWREFAIHCLKPSTSLDLKHFEELDWRELDHTNPSLWQAGTENLDRTQAEFIAILQQQDDGILEQNVRGRQYNHRKLITGIIQHDIYHLGQIAFVTKALKHR